MRELNFAEVSTVSGGESSYSLIHGFDQPTNVTSKGLASTAVNVGKAIGLGAAAEAGSRLADKAIDAISSAFSSTSASNGRAGGMNDANGNGPGISGNRGSGD